MVQLKQVLMRLKSIKNIQKITKTMKMVSASKFTKAERALKSARPFGYSVRKFYESTHLVIPPKSGEKKEGEGAPEPPKPAIKGDVKGDERKTNQIYIAITSDRGLCGGVHSGVARRVRRDMLTRQAVELPQQHRLICVGDKSRSMLRRTFAKNMLISCKDIGKTSPVFADASLIAMTIVDSNFKYDMGEIFYNKYFTPVKYELTVIPIFNKYRVEAAPNMTAFDDVEEDQLESYAEWTLAALLYYVMMESAASEQSARMSAMDNATNNADDMIDKLTLLFNRTRQAVITRELIEIISGAAALK